MIKHRTSLLHVAGLLAALLSGCSTGAPLVAGNVLSTTPMPPGQQVSPTSSGSATVTQAGNTTDTQPNQNPAGFSTPATAQPTGAPLTNQNPASFTTPGGPIPTSIGFRPTPQPVTPATAAPVTSAATATTAAGTTGGSAERGKAIFTGVGTCNACHDVAAGIKIVGPSLKGVASRAGNREPALSAEDYLRESILQPNKFIVPDFAPNIMPQVFSQRLSAQQIDDLIAYLMTLK
jgi:cytochrome c551/c552